MAYGRTSDSPSGGRKEWFVNKQSGMVGWSKASVFKTSRIYEYTKQDGGFKDEVDEKCVCINLERASTLSLIHI